MHPDWNTVVTLALGIAAGFILHDLIRFAARLIAGAGEKKPG